MKKWILPVLLPLLLLAACSESSLKNVVFTDLSTTGTGDDTISLSWTTDTAVDCTVFYGPYSFYSLTASAGADADKLTHTITLTYLRPHTNYHFKISANPESSDYQNTETGGYEENTTFYDNGASAVNDDTWEAVGALCFADADGFYGPFCTGVLIADDVVLTAAHCLEVDADYYGRVPSAANMVFYVGGNDAAPTEGDGEPASGTVYGVDQIVPHLNFNSDTLANDLTLVHLTGSVSGVTPIDYNSTPLTTGLIDQNFTAVGFDASYSGIKENSWQTLNTLYSDSFTYNENAYTLGAAGIPAFMNIGGEQKVIGVTMQVSPASNNPFVGEAAYTRVDQLSPWIEATIVEFNSP